VLLRNSCVIAQLAALSRREQLHGVGYYRLVQAIRITGMLRLQGTLPVLKQRHISLRSMYLSDSIVPTHLHIAKDNYITSYEDD
jgi:hypothetical protein